MRPAHTTTTFALGLLGLLASSLAPALAAPPEDSCSPDSPYGNAVTGETLEIQSHDTHQMQGNEEWRTVIIHGDGTLDTRGYVLKVCGQLINYGEITDTRCGGYGTTGGAGSWGADPCDSPPGNPKPDECTPGSCDVGDPEPVCAGGGWGGDGGGGGGGGGGAMWPQFSCQVDADGGNGGAGGAGGRGGGVVRIHTYRLNNHGVIQADGSVGENGADGEDGERWPWAGKDLAGGGGGGGAGGDGGEGGTVEVHYCHPEHLNREGVHASGGESGKRGDGGAGHTCIFATPLGRKQPGCDGDCGGGDGGDGEYALYQSSGDGGWGDGGNGGLNGVATLTWDCCDYEHTNFELRHYELDLRIYPDPDDEEIQGSNVMEVECLVDNAKSFGFRLDQHAFSDPVVWVRDESTDWVELAWDWGGDFKTACAIFDRPRNQGEVFYFRVDYAGNPRTVPGALGGTEGMHFMEHGPEGEEVPIVFTTVSPWFAYLWWPVKDDGENWNCDEATADLSFTMPSWMTVVSNGAYPAREVVVGDWKTCDWAVLNRVPAYLFAVAATDYHVEAQLHEGIWVVFYLWPEDEELTKFGLPAGTATLQYKIDEYSKVLGMLTLFSQDENEKDPDDPDARFGPYPFADEKYAIYQWPAGGGMEHQTATGLETEWGEFKHFPTEVDIPFFRNFWTLFPKVEYQNAHELGHSWWGDLITPATWNHIWISEGFASYSEAIWFETQYWRDDIPPFILPKEPLRTLRRYMRVNRLWAMSAQALHDHVYCYDETDFNEIYDYVVEYLKAPWVLHMLRHVVDPEYYDQEDNIATPRFFEILRKYREDYEEAGCATTEDFKAAAQTICEQYGLYDLWETYEGHPGGVEYRNLDWFFGVPVGHPDYGYGWVYGRGAPLYEVWGDNEYDWMTGQRYYNLQVKQIHREMFFAPEWANEPLFTMPIDIVLEHRNLPPTELTIWNYLEEQDYLRIPVDARVSFARFDPDEWVLKRWKQPPIPGLVTDLGIAAVTDAPAAGINSQAQVAAGLGADGGYAAIRLAQPYYYLAAGTTAIGTLPGDASSIAFDINEQGQIVGESKDTGGSSRAFLWLPEPALGYDSAGIHELETPYPLAGAHGLNNDGQIVGYAGMDTESYHAVLWKYDAVSELWDVVDLGTLGGNKSEAWAINNSFLIGGAAQTATGETHAVIWEYSPATDTWLIDDLGEVGSTSSAYGTNDAGQIVGQLAGEAKRWDYDQQGGGWQPVPLPCGRSKGGASVAYAINNRGLAVGQCGEHACLWQGEQETDLNDYVSGVTTCGDLKAAWDVNDAGLIVGYREVSGNSDPQVFLLNVSGTATCNGNNVLDACDIIAGTSPDCNGNGYPDECDLAEGFSQDDNGNGVPDECDCPPVDGFGSGTSPPSGAIDARKPHRNNAVVPCYGFGMPDDPYTASTDESLHTPVIIDLGIAGAGDPECWRLSEAPDMSGSPCGANALVNVVDNGDGTYTVELAHGVQAGTVTRIHYLGGDCVVYIHHPANVDGSAFANGNDITEVVDCLNAPGTCDQWQEDVDFSGTAGANDIIEEIDLLNGAGAYAPGWFDTPLPSEERHGP